MAEELDVVRGLRNRFTIRVVALLILATAVMLSGASCSAAVSGLPAGVVPVDVSATAINMAPGMISESDAIAVVTSKYRDLLGKQGTAEAYLVTATDPTTNGLIVDRALWIVHLSGIKYAISIPAGASIDPNQTSVSSGFVYVDAYTGTWLLSRFEG